MEKLTKDKLSLLNAGLYPTGEAKSFFENELNAKLYELLPKEIIFAEANLFDDIRTQNYWYCVEAVGNLLCENPQYKNALSRFFEGESLLDIIKLVLIHFVYHMSSNSEEYNGVNFLNIPECILHKQMVK